MDDFEFREHIPYFTSVGMLRELLKNYPDDTPITVCGTPGLFLPIEEHRYILLETMDSGDYDDTDDIELPTSVSQEYMDF